MSGTWGRLSRWQSNICKDDVFWNWPDVASNSRSLLTACENFRVFFNLVESQCLSFMERLIRFALQGCREVQKRWASSDSQLPLRAPHALALSTPHRPAHRHDASKRSVPCPSAKHFLFSRIKPFGELALLSFRASQSAAPRPPASVTGGACEDSNSWALTSFCSIGTSGGSADGIANAVPGQEHLHLILPVSEKPRGGGGDSCQRSRLSLQRNQRVQKCLCLTRSLQGREQRWEMRSA